MFAENYKAMYKYLILTKLIIFLTSTTALSQKTIVGVVTNSNNEPFADVKVSSKDNPDGVLTSENGEYKIEVSDDCNELIFTHNELVFSEIIKDRVVINKMMKKETDEFTTKNYRFNVMLNGGGTIVWGALSGSVMLTEHISFDIGLGLGKAYTGSTVYFNSPFNNKHWQPYIGANIAYFEEFMGPTSRLLYIPLGMRFIGNRGTSISFEVAGLMSDNDRFMIKVPFWGGIKFGKYF